MRTKRGVEYFQKMMRSAAVTERAMKYGKRSDGLRRKVARKTPRRKERQRMKKYLLFEEVMRGMEVIMRFILLLDRGSHSALAQGRHFDSPTAVVVAQDDVLKRSLAQNDGCIE